MGRRLDGFDVTLEFNAEGEVAKAFYHDSDGCGHEREFSPDHSIQSMVRYHLDHYKDSHLMVPPRVCGFSVQIEGGGRLDCQKERHSGSEQHIFIYDTH